jgi:hypothetical protein
MIPFARKRATIKLAETCQLETFKKMFTNLLGAPM